MLQLLWLKNDPCCNRKFFFILILILILSSCPHPVNLTLHLVFFFVFFLVFIWNVTYGDSCAAATPQPWKRFLFCSGKNSQITFGWRKSHGYEILDMSKTAQVWRQGPGNSLLITAHKASFHCVRTRISRCHYTIMQPPWDIVQCALPFKWRYNGMYSIW